MSSYFIKWDGGDSQLHVMTMSEMDPDKWKAWDLSLATQPTILGTEMNLTPIDVSIFW